jgi:regulatory protein
MRKAGVLLSRRACSRSELRGKLARTSDCPEELERVLDRLEELGLLNDAEYAYNFASKRIQEKGWGPLKAYHALLRRKVPAEIAESSVARIRSETGEHSLLQNYLEQYWRNRGIPGNRADLRRLIGHLSRRGYREELVVEVLRRLVRPDVWRSFHSE